MANFGQSHWIVRKQFFCYLKGIVDFGLCFKKKTRMLLWAQCILMSMLTIVGVKHILKRFVNHSRGLKKNMKGQTHFDKNVNHSQCSERNMRG